MKIQVIIKLSSCALASLAIFLDSCSEKPEEKSAATPSIQPKPATEKINKDTAFVVQDSINSIPEGEPIVFIKTSWGYNHGHGHFLYSNHVDLLVHEKAVDKEKDAVQDDLMSGYEVLDLPTLTQLNTKELLYYCLAYPCAYSQNCAAISLPPNQIHYFLFYLPPPLDDRYPSPLQIRSLQDRKDSVNLVLKNVFSSATTIDLEYLNLVYSANLVEMIPLLCKKAGFNTNPYIYTLFIRMMDNDFKPFMESAFLEKLREKTGEWGQMEATDEDAKQLLTYAMKFYQSQTKK